MKTTIFHRFNVGQRVRMTQDAIDHYGAKYSGQSFIISHKATRYMPAADFYRKDMPAGSHPGFDEGAGCALYDLHGLGMSLYDYELTPA